MIACFFILATATAPAPQKIPWGGTDFVQYYATARLLQQGQNPYDQELSSQIQMQLGRGSGLPTYGPPWCLLPAFLLGYLSFPQAVSVNLAVNVLLLLLCTLAWTNLLFPQKIWLLPVMCLAILIWLPIWLLLGLGQNSLWPLAGFTGWLWFTTRGYPLSAGACMVLLVVKPHLGLLLGLFAGTAMFRQRQTRAIIGFLLALGLATLITFLIRPSVWSDYLIALQAGPSPMQFYGATLDGWLRFQGGDSWRLLTWSIWGLGLLVGISLGWRLPKAAAEEKKGKGEMDQYSSAPLLRFSSAPFLHCSAILCIATLAIVPHAYSYDFVLMIPGFILALGSWLIWKSRLLFLILLGWLLMVVFYSDGLSKVLQEQNFFIIPWSLLVLSYFGVHRESKQNRSE